MKKLLQSLSLVFLSSVSLTSCTPEWQEQELMPQPEQNQELATRTATSNLIYLHDQITRFNSAQEAFNHLTRTGIVVVDFYADWCGPCRTLGTTLKSVANEYAQVTFLKVNVDKFKQLSSSIRSIPVLAFYKNGKEVKRVTGAKSKKELKKILNSL